MLTKNNNFLNNYFTSNEFNFIENMDSNFIFLSQALKNEINNRDLVVKLINGLNDSIYFSGINNKSDENEQKALTSAKNIFELINNNIDLIQSNIDLSNSINNGIVDLLIKIDADEKDISPDKYSEEINNLKNKINDISSNFEDLKLKIDTNNNQISEFFNTDSIKTYIKDFSIELNTEPDNNTTDNNDENSDIVSKTDTVSEDEDNNVLLVSEKDKRVYLPYSKEEVLEYLKQYPEQYNSFDDVIKKEFIFSSDYYLKHPITARFREAYSLIRDREAKSMLEAFKYSIDIMFNSNLNPVIIAACKSQSQLENYIKCLSENNLDEFKDFEIKFDVTPLKV